MSDFPRNPVRRPPPRRGIAPRLILLLLVAAAVVVSASRIRQQQAPSSPPRLGPLTVTFFDVGAGESTLIQTPTGKNILVDTGPPSARLALFSGLQHCRVHFLDMILTTQPGSDYSGNTEALLQRVPVGRVMGSGLSALREVKIAERPGMAQSSIPGASLPVRSQIGKTIDLGGGTTLQYLAPTGHLPRAEDNGVMFRINQGRVCILITGGAGTHERAALMALVPDLHATVLQAAPATLTGGPELGFLGRVQPEDMIISRRLDSPIRHRSPAEQFAFHPLQSRTWRTDQHGTLTLQTNGASYRIIPCPQ